MPHAEKISDTAAHMADEAASAITDKARETVALAERTASDVIDDHRTATSRYVSDLSIAAYAAADSLDRSGHARSSDYVTASAHMLEDAGETLSSYDVNRLIDDAANVVRRNPGLSAALAAFAGYSLVKLASHGRKDPQRGY